MDAVTLTKTCQNLMATFFAILNKMSEGSRNNSKYIYICVNTEKRVK